MVSRNRERGQRVFEGDAIPAFQASKITFEDVPMPIANRPGAASAGLAALIAGSAGSAGPRGVKAGMIATPSRIAGAQGGRCPGA